MEIAGALFIIVFGTLGHFIFEWSGHRRWAGICFAVNESTWEHIKLTIYPSLIWMVVEGCVRGWCPLLLASQAAAMAVMMSLIPLLFYGYTAVVGRNFLITDIICFLVSVACGMLTFHWIVNSEVTVSPFMTGVFIAFLLVVTAAYLVFSYFPPHNFLFRDPVSGGFGPQGHDCNADFHKTGHKHHHRH